MNPLNLKNVLKIDQELKKKESEKRRILWGKSSWRKNIVRNYNYVLVKLRRVTKVTKGGRRFRFLAVALAGDAKGKVGFGTGKGNEVSSARQKAFAQAEKNMIYLPFLLDTIPHEVIGTFCGAKILLKPASKGTGIVVGSSARLVMELIGINNIRGKSLGSNNPVNLIRATFAALKKLRTREEVFALRDIVMNSNKKKL